jgi:hypothetical protein
MPWLPLTLHRNLSVESENNARIAAAIQNRMMTLDSLHPFISK